LCRVLKVNRSTYYKHFDKQPAHRTVENQQLRTAILDIYIKSRKRFGAYKITQRLSAENGINISVGRVYRLMKTMQLPKMSTIKPRVIQRSLPETDLNYPNLLQKQFAPTAPNQVWVSDITYVRVGGRFRYVCAILDLFARKLIACKTSGKPNAEFVISTLESAYYDRGSPKNVLFHSDRGCQYTSFEFRKLIDRLNFIQSFSAKAHPFDNAVVESFFKYLKHEELNRKSFNSISELDLTLFEYAHFYNKLRPHSFNDGLTPSETEDNFYDNL
jgi:putative transposase